MYVLIVLCVCILFEDLICLMYLCEYGIGDVECDGCFGYFFCEVVY